MTAMNAREFNPDVSAAKRAACDDPVLITDRGVPAYVLLSIEEYQRLGDQGSADDPMLCVDHGHGEEPQVDTPTRTRPASAAGIE